MNDDYRNVLVAIDGSKQSEKAFAEALAVTKRNDAKLHIVAIINDAELSTSAFSFSKIFAQEKERVETEVLKRIHDATENGIDNSEAFVEVGNPKQVIVKYADENKIDLIVIGSTGKGALSQQVIGSTTAYVVNHATCNVLVVR